MLIQVVALSTILAITNAGQLLGGGISTGYGGIGVRHGAYRGLGAGYGGINLRYGGLGVGYGGLGAGYGGLGAGYAGLGAGHGGLIRGYGGLGAGYGGLRAAYGGLGAGYGAYRGIGITSGGIGYGRDYDSVDYYAPPRYEYKYGVQDPHTGDWKEKMESRVGSLTQTQYAWGEGDRQVQEARVFANH